MAAYYASFLMDIGFTDAPSTNVEAYTGLPPMVLPDQLLPLRGPNRSQSQDNMVTRSGTPSFFWTFNLMLRANFNAYLDHYFGDTDSIRVTINTFDERNDYAWAYVVAERPVVGEHYTIATGGAYIQDLKQIFHLDAESGLGAFNGGFSSGFRI